MNSVVQIYINKDGVERKMHCHNIVTTEGDLHYARSVAGEDTTTAFPNILLEFGAEPPGEFVDPEKFYDGTLVPITTKPVTKTYLEPYASYVYEIAIRNDIPVEHHGAIVYQIALVNGESGSAKKAISVVNLPEPIVLSDLMYATFKIKHTIHFPGTEDNTVYRSPLIHKDKTMFLDLPDLNSNEINLYYIENLPTGLTTVIPYPFYKNLTLLEKNKVHVTVYRSKCQELDRFICIPYEHDFLGCADVDTIYTEYTTDSIKQVPAIPYNAFVSYHTFIVPISTGLWRFSYKGGFLIEVYLNGQRALVANTQNDGIFEDVGYVYLEAGKQYSMVVNHAQVISKEPFELLVAPPKWSNLQSVGLPFNPSGTKGIIDYYNDTDANLSTMDKHNFSVIKYGITENFEDSRKFSLCALPNSNKHLLRIDYPKNKNSLLPLIVNSGFISTGDISAIRINYLDIYYRSALKLIDGGAAFPTVHIYDLLKDRVSSNSECYNSNIVGLNIFLAYRFVDGNNYRVICPYTVYHNVNPESKKNFCITSLVSSIPLIGTIIIEEDGTLTFNPSPTFEGTVPTIHATLEDTNTGEEFIVPIIIVTGLTKNEPAALVYTEAGTNATGDIFAGLTDITPETHEVTTFTVGDNTDELAVNTPVDIPGVGTVLVHEDGTFEFTPEAGYTGVVPVIEVNIKSKEDPTEPPKKAEALIVVGDEPKDKVILLHNGVDETIVENIIDRAAENDENIDPDNTIVTGFTVGDDPTVYPPGVVVPVRGVSGALTMIPAGGTPKTGYLLGSNPECVGPPPAHFSEYRYLDIPACVGVHYTNIYDLEEDPRVNVCPKSSLKVRYKPMVDIISCADKPFTHIYKVSLELINCIVVFNHLYSVEFKANWYNLCTSLINIYDISKDELPLQVCVYTNIYNINRDKKVIDEDVCVGVGLLMRGIGVDAAVSKNFCATLKLPPPPGEG